MESFGVGLRSILILNYQRKKGKRKYEKEIG